MTEGPERTIAVSPYAAADDETIRIARQAMKQYNGTLRALAN